ncbi:MAG: STAS domain-containing protein [Halobacteriovoraceae bacterium]|nr:STAS domain-containing protein [Halobacteriovoraceae bacterium]
MVKNRIFYPKIITTLKNYSLQSFYQDAMAGILVGIVALPLSIAFGIASGVEPQQGIITAIIAGFLISLLGGSRVQIGGPTGAFIVIVYGVVEKFGLEGLILATFISGFILILMGALKIGDWIKLIPAPIITGFTSGIAVVIFSSQVKDLLGLPINKVPAEFLLKWETYFQNFDKINFYAPLLAFATIAIILGLNKVSNKIPAAFVAIVLTTMASLFFHLPVETIGDKFGVLLATFPAPRIPHYDFNFLGQILPSAFAIAMLGAIESLLSAVVSDSMIGGKHRSNTELIGQGIANVITPLFGGIPATGAIARTVTNIKNGGRSPIAGIVHSMTLFIIFFYVGKYASFIPFAVLAGILTIVSYNMSEWREFRSLCRGHRYDVLVLLCTFFITVIFDLVLAIEIGLVLSSFLFAKRISETTNVKLMKSIEGIDPDTYYDDPNSLHSMNLPKEIMVFEIEGAFFFGASSRLERFILESIEQKKVIVLRMNKLLNIDATGVKTLLRLYEDLEKKGVSLKICDCPENIANLIENSELSQKIDCLNLRKALPEVV